MGRSEGSCEWGDDGAISNDDVIMNQMDLIKRTGVGIKCMGGLWGP